jgi:hypothetical protein
MKGYATLDEFTVCNHCSSLVYTHDIKTHAEFHAKLEKLVFLAQESGEYQKVIIDVKYNYPVEK